MHIKAGFIKWTVYDLVQDRIKRTMNGTWMFKEQDQNTKNKNE
jgi:hypothetical protein